MVFEHLGAVAYEFYAFLRRDAHDIRSRDNVFPVVVFVALAADQRECAGACIEHVVQFTVVIPLSDQIRDRSLVACIARTELGVLRIFDESVTRLRICSLCKCRKRQRRENAEQHDKRQNNAYHSSENAHNESSCLLKYKRHSAAGKHIL